MWTGFGDTRTVDGVKYHLGSGKSGLGGGMIFRKRQLAIDEAQRIRRRGKKAIVVKHSYSYGDLWAVYTK